MMDRRKNKVHAGLSARNCATGVAVQLASPEIVEMVGAAGFDFVYIDCEHGSIGFDRLVEMIRGAEAVGLTALVRVPSQDRSFIMRVLDAGALGVVVPGVSSAKEAAAIVSAVRYRENGDDGTRGACPGSRATWHQAQDWPAHVRWSNDTVMAWLIIETEAAIDAIDEIVAVPGIGALMLGPYDLAHEMGYPGEPRHPRVAARLARVTSAARAAGVEVVASLFSPTASGVAAEKAVWLESGVRIHVVGSDRRMFMNALRERWSAEGPVESPA